MEALDVNTLQETRESKAQSAISTSKTSTTGTTDVNWSSLSKDAILHILSFFILEPYMLKGLECYGRFKNGSISLLYTTVDLNILCSFNSFSSPSMILLYFSCRQILGAHLVLVECSMELLENMADSMKHCDFNGIFRCKVKATSASHIRDCFQILQKYPNMYLDISFSEAEPKFVLPASLEEIENLKLVELIPSIKERVSMKFLFKTPELLEWFSEAGVLQSLVPSKIHVHIWLDSMPRHNYWPPVCNTSININAHDNNVEQVVLILESLYSNEEDKENNHARYSYIVNQIIFRSDSTYNLKNLLFSVIMELCQRYNVRKLTTSLDSVHYTGLDYKFGKGCLKLGKSKYMVQNITLKSDESDSDEYDPSIDEVAYFMCSFSSYSLTVYQLNETSPRQMLKAMQILNNNECKTRLLHLKDFSAMNLRMFLSLLPETVTISFDFEFGEEQDAWDVLLNMKTAKCKMHIILFDPHHDLLDELYDINNLVLLQVYDYDNEIMHRDYLISWIKRRKYTASKYLISNSKCDHTLHTLKQI